MNYFDIQDNFLTVKPYVKDVAEITNGLTDYIVTQDCEHLSIDISKLNLVDSLRVSAVCSVYHFSKYPSGNIEWVVKDLEIRNSLKLLALKTVKVSVKKPIVVNMFPIQSRKVVALR